MPKILGIDLGTTNSVAAFKKIGKAENFKNHLFNMVFRLSRWVSKTVNHVKPLYYKVEKIFKEVFLSAPLKAKLKNLYFKRIFNGLQLN